MVSLGAPFWYDLIGRVVNTRGTGEKPFLTRLLDGKLNLTSLLPSGPEKREGYS